MDYRVLAQEELKSLPMLASASANTAMELEEIKLKLRSAKTPGTCMKKCARAPTRATNVCSR